MRTLLAFLLLCPAICFAADTPATTTFRHGDKESKFGEGLGTQFEGGLRGRRRDGTGEG